MYISKDIEDLGNLGRKGSSGQPRYRFFRTNKFKFDKMYKIFSKTKNQESRRGASHIKKFKSASEVQASQRR